MIRLLLLSLALLLAACTSSPPAAPLHVFVGLDRSGSAEDLLAGFVREVGELGERLSPQRDRLTCYRLDSGLREWYDGPAPQDPEQFQLQALESVEQAATRDGTRPGLFFEEVAARLRTWPDREVRVLVLCLWDGGDDDLSAAGQAAGRQALRALAADPRVRRVALRGLRNETRIPVRRRFQDFGERLEMGELELGSLLGRARE